MAYSENLLQGLFHTYLFKAIHSLQISIKCFWKAWKYLTKLCRTLLSTSLQHFFFFFQKLRKYLLNMVNCGKAQRPLFAYTENSGSRRRGEKEVWAVRYSSSEHPSYHIRDKLLKKFSLNVRVKNYKLHVIICLCFLRHKGVKMYFHLKSIFIQGKSNWASISVLCMILKEKLTQPSNPLQGQRDSWINALLQFKVQ